MKHSHQRVSELMKIFLNLHNKDFDVFPGLSFTNLIYVGMQDIQYHFPEYKKFPINTEKGLRLHINDLFHSDYSILKKCEYISKAFFRLSKKGYFLKDEVFSRGMKYINNKLRVEK